MSVVPSMADRDGKIWMDGQMVEWTLFRPPVDEAGDGNTPDGQTSPAGV